MSEEYQDMTDAVGGLDQLDPAEVGVYLASPEALVSLPSSPAAVPPTSAAPTVRRAHLAAPRAWQYHFELHT